MISVYKLLSVLLLYPQPEWLAALNDIDEAVQQQLPEQAGSLKTLTDTLRQGDLIELQEVYVNTFDRSPAHSLHLFEHLHGEDRARGQAMVDLLEEYGKYGVELDANELPDYLPLFLEFLSVCPADKAENLLGEAVHVIAHVGNQLAKSSSPYAAVFEALLSLSPITPQPLVVPPIRDMDEALERFGPDAQGLEPLLKQTSATQPVQFMPGAARRQQN
ncbi:nitrate reductase molybdenum cofactor assembly chaperone [Stenoxybacter acetivorans]|uniref:nitrate reductase molybdenum cofactor assembly chaperone n=1 Tax=Stenoxybacter acetivorans TaxID=422441 RepID=UPI00056B4DBD|nr:nitrate reductase molybdenum cofactor assembly chaperone [Stenoxybacter acetivorans]